MKEQLVKFETAKLASEKGYGPILLGSNFKDKLPTQSLLQKWLREKHNIIVTSDCAIEGEWWYQLKHSPTEMIRIYKSTGLLGDSKTYEEALEKGLIEALKLIKNKKNEKI